MDHVIEKLLYFDMMTTRVLTLFGEEELPAAPKPAAAKKKRAPSPDPGSAPETTPEPEAAPEIPGEQTKEKEPRSDAPPAILNEEIRKAESGTDTTPAIISEEIREPETGTDTISPILNEEIRKAESGTDTTPAIISEEVKEPESGPDTISPILNEEIKEAEKPVNETLPATDIPELPKDETVTIEAQGDGKSTVKEPETAKNLLAESEVPLVKIPSRPAEKKSPAAKKPPREKKAAPAKTGSGTDEQPSILSDWQPEKQYYTIGETAALFGVNISHIRFWTNQFALKVRTTRKGDRLYTPAIIQELRTIYHLVKERGFTLNGAKTRLKEQKKGEIEALNLRQSLLNLRSHLVEIRNRIT